MKSTLKRNAEILILLAVLLDDVFALTMDSVKFKPE